MSLNLKIGLFYAVLFSVMTLLACRSSEPISLEEKAQEIDKLLMCPVCPAETIAEAQVPIARDMRLLIRQKLNDGLSKQQILDYFSSEERYGPIVLAEPPKAGLTLLIWIVPLGFVCIAILILYFTLKAMQRTSSNTTESCKTSNPDRKSPVTLREGESSSEDLD
jgi:cytochrome c-type biogenesis protein CcmH